MPDLDEAIADVRAGRVQRVCSPGQWLVWREGDEVRVEIMA
jgi:hypothetical protein